MFVLVLAALVLNLPTQVRSEKLSIGVCNYCKYCEHCSACKDCPCEPKTTNFCNYCTYCKYCSWCGLCSSVCDSDGVVGGGVAAIARFFGNEPVPDVPSDPFDQATLDDKLRKHKKDEL